METYKHFFRACRVPGDPIDRLEIYPQDRPEHFIVAAYNQVSFQIIQKY